MCNDGKHVERTQYVRLDSGDLIAMPDDAVGMIFPLERAKSRAVEITQLNQTFAPRRTNFQPNNFGAMNQIAAAGPVQVARQTDGGAEATRLEAKGKQTGSIAKITLTMRNTSGSPIRHIVFDGFNINARNQGITPLPQTGFDVSGTFGTDTLVMLHTITRANPIRIKNLHIRSSTGDFVSNGQLRTLVGTIANTIRISDIVLSGAIKPNQFQQNIIELTDYDQLVDGFVGLDVTVADQESLTFTWDVVSVSEAYNMGNRNG